MTTPKPRLEPPRPFLEIAQALESRGYQAWAVGGAVRDGILGQRRADWDLATDAHPADVQRTFPRTVPIGVEHGTVGVLGSDGALYEVTTFRLDVETDGRHAVVEFAQRIEDDLARRDFTINAMAWRPETDELLDPFEGREDLRTGVLRAVGEPADRFAEDYLRVLRGLRFAGGLALEIEARTGAALRSATARLDRLSAERVREELMKVLGDRAPSTALRLYSEMGVLEGWYRELAHVATDPRWELDLAAVDAISSARSLLRLARWLMPIADEAESRGHLGRDLMQRLRFSNASLHAVVELLLNSPPLVAPTDSSARLRQWLSDVGRGSARDLFRLQFADARAAGGEERGRLWVELWRRIHAELLTDPPLEVGDLAVDGGDLLALGVAEGPAIGILLDELHAQALEDPSMNDRDRLLAKARELLEIASLGEEPGIRGESGG